MICRPLSYGDGFVRGVIDFVDCQTQHLGQGGYQALAAPGSAVSLAITGMLTILIALYGYRMMLGHTPSARDGVMLLAKIGIVVALATSWPAYRALFYDVTLHGPAQLASEAGRPTGNPGSDGGLVGRLQGVDAALVLLGEYGVGSRKVGGQAVYEGTVNGQRQLMVEQPRQSSQFEEAAIGWSRVFFLVGTLGSLAAVRLISGVLLAFGPLFIAFLLFEGTRGLFEGWVRGLAGAALGAAAVTLLLGAELALVEPWLAYLLAMRQAKLGIMGAPVEVMVVMLVFGVALGAALFAVARVAAGFRLPRAWRDAAMQTVSGMRGDARLPAHVPAGRAAAAAERSRAAQVAEAVAASQRRELVAITAGRGAGRGPTPAIARDVSQPAPVPIGQQGTGRRGRTRLSASAGRRDRRS